MFTKLVLYAACLLPVVVTANQDENDLFVNNIEIESNMKLSDEEKTLFAFVDRIYGDKISTNEVNQDESEVDQPQIFCACDKFDMIEEGLLDHLGDEENPKSIV